MKNKLFAVFDNWFVKKQTNLVFWKTFAVVIALGTAAAGLRQPLLH